MAVIVEVQVENQTEALYDGMLSALAPPLRQAAGFVMHGAWRDATGVWRVVEVWQSKAQADMFFALHVAPALPPGVRPRRRVSEMHALVLPDFSVPETAR